jgi:arylsulfatase A-like enzyme
MEAGLRLSSRDIWRRGLPFLFALLLATIEFAGVLGHLRASRGEIEDAFFSAALVYALYATVFMLSGFIPARGLWRGWYLLVFHVVLGAVGTVLFSSWMVRWVLGQPLSGDATHVLLESPAASIFHLREDEALFLSILFIGLAVFLYLCGRVLHSAARVWAGTQPSSRALSGGMLALGAALLSWRIASAGLSWSSFASVLSAQGAVDPAPPTYSCELAPPVSKAPMPISVGNHAPVIVVVLESVRADVLRDHADAVPFLSSMSRNAVVFDKVYSAATHSDFADIALWYSRYALYADHRRGFPERAQWRGTSAFEFFKASGYRTGYFSSQDERWGGMIHWMRIDAVDSYFDAWNYLEPDHADPTDSARIVKVVSSNLTDTGKVEDWRTLELASAWVERHRDEVFFLGLNLQNTHFPYRIPAGAAEPFQPYERTVRDSLYGLSADRVELLRNRYLNSIYDMDAQLSAFAQHLQAMGVWDKSIVLFVGDHGEAFLEHGYESHGSAAFDEMSRPLAILKLPKGDRRNGTVFERPISSIDFVPLLTQLAGLPEWRGFQGSSPFTRKTDAPVFITVNGLTRENDVVRWPWKFMSRKFPVREFQLYNLETDPEEAHNLVRDNPAMAASLAADVNAWRKCQVSYYADADAYSRLQPPRY